MTRYILIFAILLIGCTEKSSDSGHHALPGSPAPSLTTSQPKPARILVIGGTSGVGRETVKLALERGHTVTAMARRPERMEMTHAHLQTIAGDILNFEDVKKAVANQDVIVIAIGMGLTRDPVSLFSDGTLNVINSMAESGGRRLIAVTGIGVEETRGHGGFFYDRILWPLGLKTVYEDKDRQEALIRMRGDKGLLDWTVVRPGFLTDDKPQHRYRVITDVEGVTAGNISRADVAHFIVAAIESNNFIAETPLISE